MIYEFAIDPLFIIEAVKNRGLCRYILSNFGHGNCCRAADFPHGWSKYIINTIKQELEKRKITKSQQIEYKAVELVNCLKEARTARLKHDDGNEWAHQALHEHKNYRFNYILTQERCEDPHAISCENVLSSEAFDGFKRSELVERTIESFICKIGPLIENSSHATLVDPYFFVDERYIKPFTKLLTIAKELKKVRCNGDFQFIIICDGNPTSKNYVPYVEFERACKSEIQPLVPEGVELTIARFKELRGHRELHNRYIITDIGGIVVARGLDVPNIHGSYDDISIMSPDQYTKRKIMYSLETADFNIEEKLVLRHRS